MNLWRISNYATLDGGGGLKTHGRWHNKGIPVVYLSEHPALAMLEVVVHFELSPDEVPKSYKLLEVDYPLSEGIQTLSPDNLPSNWASQQDYTRAVGDEWLTSMSGVLLRVPSVVVPNSFNCLFNPRHPLAEKATILSATQHPFDQRLFS